MYSWPSVPQAVQRQTMAPVFGHTGFDPVIVALEKLEERGSGRFVGAVEVRGVGDHRGQEFGYLACRSALWRELPLALR